MIRLHTTWDESDGTQKECVSKLLKLVYATVIAAYRIKTSEFWVLPTWSFMPPHTWEYLGVIWEVLEQIRNSYCSADIAWNWKLGLATHVTRVRCSWFTLPSFLTLLLSSHIQVCIGKKLWDVSTDHSDQGGKKVNAQPSSHWCQNQFTFVFLNTTYFSIDLFFIEYSNFLSNCIVWNVQVRAWKLEHCWIFISNWK